MKAFEFEVPATAANLGPGFGTLGLALDLKFRVKVEPSDFDGIVIERTGESTDDAAEATANASILDMRHDSVLRALRSAAERFSISLPKGLTVTIEGNVPRSIGLGTNTADVVAGATSALRIGSALDSKAQVTADQLLDFAVELGADPGHAAGALSGGLAFAVPAGATNHQGEWRRQFRVRTTPLHPSWHFIVVAPKVDSGTAEAHRVVPASLPHGVVTRTAARLAALLQALEGGDEDLLSLALEDESHVPFRLDATPGLRESFTAAHEAGAAGATICGHGPAVVALTTDADLAKPIREALEQAFQSAEVAARSRICKASETGALATS